MEDIKANSKWSVEGFVAQVKRDAKAQISKVQAYQTKKKILIAIHGSHSEQDKRWWEYYDIIKKINTGSTMLMGTLSREGKKSIFQRLYACLEACKIGFLNRSRSIIGLNRCHRSVATISHWKRWA